jgi:hypothetical protein
MGRSEATTIFPEPSENAKNGSGQVIRAHTDSAAVPTATLAQSNVRLNKRSKMASIAIIHSLHTARLDHICGNDRQSPMRA